MQSRLILSANTGVITPDCSCSAAKFFALKEFSKVEKAAEGEEGEVVKSSSILASLMTLLYLFSRPLWVTCLYLAVLAVFLTSEMLLSSSDEISINFSVFHCFLLLFMRSFCFEQ